MEQAIEKYRRYLERRYPGRSTAKHYSSDLKIFSQFVGDLRPREITIKMVDEFIESQQGLKAATINRRVASLSSFFDFLIDEAGDDGRHNPVRWKRHSIKQGRHLPRDVSDETVRQLFAVLDDCRDRAIFTLMISAGLRVGEVVQLQLNEVPQVETNIVSRLRVSGKGDKERIAWLTTEAMRPIQQWLQQRPTNDTKYLFVSQHGHPLSVSGVQYRLKQYCAKAKVQVTCHQLRHTFARRLAEHGLPIESLAKLLGHRSIQTTQLYIDGADPTVRHDFLRTMEKATRLESQPAHSEVAQGHTILSSTPPTRQERPSPRAIADQLAHLGTDLPSWLYQALRRYLISRISRWQAHQARLHAHNLLATLCRLARWLVQHRQWSALDQLQRTDLKAYVQAAQQRGLKPQSIGAELKVFRGFWRDLLDQELVTNGAPLLVKAPTTTSDPLPRYLTPTEFQRLEQLLLAETAADRPQDRFNRTWFYLLAHAGLRRGELLNLRLSDCDLSTQRLRVQAGKGDRDRVVPMSQPLVTALANYIVVRQPAPTDHLLIQRASAVNRSLIVNRLKQFGLKANIPALSPHRLRHTLATLLVNQGMPIISLQKFLGHRDINKTMIYARVFDQTVCQQFTAAMANIEGIPVPGWPQQLEQLNPEVFSTAS